MAPVGAAGVPAQSELVKRAMASLRGRYVLLIAVGLVIGAAGAVIGRRFGKVLYTSEGLIRIAYVQPKVMKEDSTMPMYDAFMRSQQLLMQSRRIVDAALQEDEWLATRRGNSAAALSNFALRLTVEQPKGTENLRVSYQDEDPNVTAAAVNALIHAYEKDYKKADQGLQKKRIDLLTELEKEHQRQIDDLNLRLAALRGEALVDVEQLHAAAVQRLQQYEGRLDDVNLGLQLAATKGQQEDARTIKTMTPRQIAFNDPTMRDLLAEQARLERELSQLQLRLGREHSSVIAAQRLLAEARAQVEEYANEARKHLAEMAQTAPMTGPQGALAMFAQPVEVLQANREVLTKMVEHSRLEVASLSSKRDEAEALRSMMQKTRQSLAEVQSRKGMLKLEMEMGDRLEVTSLGQVPLMPTRDTRMRLMVAGGLGGMLLPACLVALFGLVNRRYRFADEAGEMARGRQLRMLGILPVLPHRLANEDRAADAAQCVHQIRVMVQGGADGGPRAYLVSSTSAREGKTSLCVALGLSFSAAGARTLLIDADMVGRGLTRGLRADGLPGLREALESGRLSIRQRPDGLSVLTAGDSRAADACKVSAVAVRRLLAEARKHFDTILIDSGPVLGSVEATVVAREVDGVIFTISRGQEPEAVERALCHLEAIGANVLGAVFNRANVTDFYRSFQSSSLRPTATTAGGARKATAPMGFDDPTLFGPVVGSVASCMADSATAGDDGGWRQG
jgi:Mrp family chromosome partitioning ATPase